MINYNFFIWTGILLVIFSIPLIIKIISYKTYPFVKKKYNHYIDLLKQENKNVENADLIEFLMKKIHFYEWLIDFKKEENNTGSIINGLLSFLSIFCLSIIILSSTIIIFTDYKSCKNWYQTINYYHNLEKPTYSDCIKAEKENENFETSNLYKKEYIDTFEKINTFELWKRFYKYTKEE